jgi:subtilisin family serine protease
MSAAGVHHVSAAGNFNNTIVLPDNIDFNNGALSHFPILVGSNDGSAPQPYIFVPLCRDDLHLAGDTIVCAALGSQFSVDSGLNNKETLASFSNRGDRIDACAAGDNIYMDLYTNGEYEATGTSFASPNIGGMAACVLGKYPATTPAQLRKYFRDHAVGTDTLYDSGTQPMPTSPSGDAPYYSDPLGLRGYSGKIAYLDPNLSFNPSTISDTSITSTQTVSASNKINFTVSQINTKLASIS